MTYVHVLCFYSSSFETTSFGRDPIVCVCAFVSNNICSVAGLIFDESQPPDATLRPEKQKPKVTLAQDPKQAKVLL